MKLPIEDYENKPDIDSFCRAYDNLLTQDQCDEYIELYEETLRVDTEKQRKLSVCYREDGTKICGDCNCMRINPQEYDRFEALNAITIDRFQQLAMQYKKDVGVHPNQWPETWGYEELRIKRFLIEDGGKTNPNMKDTYHGLEEHVDIYSFAHAKRFLCIMVYLNDDFWEGQTIFPLFDTAVKPKKGQAFVFPPMWTYLHYGAAPKGPSKLGAKYFLMTHLNYIDKTKVNSYEGKSFIRTEAANDPLLNTRGMS